MLVRFMRRERTVQRSIPLGIATRFGRRRPDLVGKFFCPFFLFCKEPVMAELRRFAGSGTFLRKEDVPHPLQLTIAKTGEHQFEEKPPQLVLYWQQPGVKPMVCNATNVRLLAALFGVQTEEQLIGRTVEVFADPTVTMRGQVVGGLRVRLPAGASPAAQHSTAFSQPPAPAPMDAPW